MSRDEEFDKYLRKRAEQLGLPTDAEAYKDGGLAEAAGSTVLSEADTLVTLLRANGIPAWLRSPLATLAAAEPQIFSVLVPAGRLADAKRLLAEHAATHADALQEDGNEEVTAEQAAADDRRAEEAAGRNVGAGAADDSRRAENRPTCAPRSPLRTRTGRTVVALVLLIVLGALLGTGRAFLSDLGSGPGGATDCIGMLMMAGGFVGLCVVLLVVMIRQGER
jgi:hypothetical protein